ncbi:hypothetical protein F511_05285 [Dorcoceras hygrometricum]|uniref:Uncharacterized protein n=1 Tax=Dorcoceras hygrometricum TaxID=472368 RepID=A0A2Z7AKK5_9LAMI|nr:hypothetical protein F511_05285 [Dorcoceras hygrometricum]
MHAPRDSVPLATIDLPAPATMAEAPPAVPPQGPADPNHTSLGPNHAPHGSNEAPKERRASCGVRGCPSHYGSSNDQT